MRDQCSLPPQLKPDSRCADSEGASEPGLDQPERTEQSPPTQERMHAYHVILLLSCVLSTAFGDRVVADHVSTLRDQVRSLFVRSKFN